MICVLNLHEKHKTWHIIYAPTDLDIVPLHAWPLVTFTTIFTLKIHCLVFISLRHYFTPLKCGFKLKVLLTETVWIYLMSIDNKVTACLACILIYAHHLGHFCREWCLVAHGQLPVALSTFLLCLELALSPLEASLTGLHVLIAQAND